MIAIYNILMVLFWIVIAVLYQSWFTTHNDNCDMKCKINRLTFLLKRMLEENPNTDKELVALVKNELNRKD